MKNIILFIIITILLGGCAQKVSIRTLVPAEIDRATNTKKISVAAFDNDRVEFYSLDFTQKISAGIESLCADANYILHLGAETHIDNSISNPERFVMANVVGTFRMLEFARVCKNLEAFVYFSTDEVFGPAPEGVNYKEWDRYNSTNPYSATKAGGEELVLAYMNTYKVPGFITHTMNIFGERQHPEKFIPLCIRKILNYDRINIHGSADGTKSGSRFYIHARNVAGAIHFLLNRFEQREKYNIVGEHEISNFELARKIFCIVKPEGLFRNYEIVDFHSSRPGHDLRYALDGSKMAAMDWKIPKTIDETLTSTVKWTLAHQEWL